MKDFKNIFDIWKLNSWGGCVMIFVKFYLVLCEMECWYKFNIIFVYMECFMFYEFIY